MWLLLQLQALSLQSEYCFGDPTQHHTLAIKFHPPSFCQNSSAFSNCQLPGTVAVTITVTATAIFLENHEKAYHVIIKAETWACGIVHNYNVYPSQHRKHAEMLINHVGTELTHSYSSA
ncbi:hypothetical protein ACSQ67_016945 [Phaseolus vulgaris]